MTKQAQLQEPFLSDLLQEKVQVSIFLVNGIKLHGIISGFDDDVIMLKNTITQMVYKNAISTVVPSRVMGASEDSEKSK